MPICHLDFQKYGIGQVQFVDHKRYSISRWTGTGSNTDSGKGLKLGKDIGVIIESGSEIELPSWGSGSYSCLSSI